MAGIIGYAGGGKSTLSRFVGYQVAMLGYNVLHISLENDGEVELDKYILMHAHNADVFGTQYQNLSYERFKKKQLTAKERAALDKVGDDFHNRVEGRIIIRQPQDGWWRSRVTNAKTLAKVIDTMSSQMPKAEQRRASQAEIRAEIASRFKPVREKCACKDEPNHC